MTDKVEETNVKSVPEAEVASLTPEERTKLEE